MNEVGFYKNKTNFHKKILGLEMAQNGLQIGGFDNKNALFSRQEDPHKIQF